MLLRPKLKKAASPSSIQRMLLQERRRLEHGFITALRRWFAVLENQAAKDLAPFAKAAKLDQAFTDWEYIEEEGERILKPAVMEVMQSGGDSAYKVFGLNLSFDIANPNSVKAASTLTANLVREVTDRTKAAIRPFISSGIHDGMSVSSIARDLKGIVGLTERQGLAVLNRKRQLQERGFHGAKLKRQVSLYTQRLKRYRHETIIRTELARAQNIGYTQGLDSLGIKEVEFEVAAGCCPDQCEPLDGTKYPIKLSGDIIPVHPNCRCCMLPVIGKETIKKPGKVNSQSQIDELLGKLLATTDRGEAKRIRSALRRLGHKGGLKGVKPPPVAAVPKPAPVVPPKSPTEVSASFFDEFDGWEGRLAAHKADLIEKLGFDPAKVNLTDENIAKFREVMRSFSAKKKISDEMRQGVDVVVDGLRGSAAVTRKWKKRIGSVYDHLEEIGGGDVIERMNKAHIYVNYNSMREIRASANPLNRQLFFGKGTQSRTVFHEMGHIVEQTTREGLGRGHRKLGAWLRMRAGNSRPVPYSKICSWSEDEQLGYKGRFIDPYVGKFYENGDTEVVSVWLQNFVSMRQGLGLAKRDFDYFAFVHGLICGAV